MKQKFLCLRNSHPLIFDVTRVLRAEKHSRFVGQFRLFKAPPAFNKSNLSNFDFRVFFQWKIFKTLNPQQKKRTIVLTLCEQYIERLMSCNIIIELLQLQHK